jgi:predicted unusual protein kinase regulating ubiquinone biosynthesis (AarF/ABC1/UbiB family)
LEASELGDTRVTERYRKVPEARLSRLAALGRMAGGVAAGALGEGLRQFARGERPRMTDLLLTPGNARRITDQLSQMRGAAMKLGQMISLDAGDVLPAELTAIMAQLREQAHVMRPRQLDQVLVGAWGRDWRRRFARFEVRPVAAASIGQVHRATLKSGRELAIKVQYPGVAASIDADIDNAASLLRYSGLLPARLDIAPLLAEAKAQLREEADYRREAEQMRRYWALLSGDPRFALPAPVDDLVESTVLPMDYLTGAPIETLSDESQTLRDKAGGTLLELVMRELFEFGFMQTDPNFANFKWRHEDGRIVLLDFGAARPVPPETTEAYRELLRAGLNEDRDALQRALLAHGFVSAAQMRRHGPAIAEMIRIVLSHVARSRECPGLFDFADRAFVGALRELAASVVADRAIWHVPPAKTLFVQRKISGTALLCARCARGSRSSRWRHAIRKAIWNRAGGLILKPSTGRTRHEPKTGHSLDLGGRRRGSCAARQPGHGCRR